MKVSEFMDVMPPAIGQVNVLRAEDAKLKATITVPFTEELYLKNTAGEMIKLPSVENFSESVL